MTKKTKVMAMLACAFAAAATIAGGSIAMAGTAESSGNQLAGTWSVTVNRPAPLPPLQSLQVYTRAGSMVESGNDSVSRSPQYASWVRLHGHEYAATGIFFRFDPQTGALVGTQKINRTIVMSEDGQSFTFSGRATVYDANAMPSPASRAAASASGSRSRPNRRPIRKRGCARAEEGRP